MSSNAVGNARHPKIGVIDSGVGGLTVVREIARLIPYADIVYFGDSANVPYGNRPESEILSLTCAMLDFMHEQGATLVAVACNTISTVIDKFQSRYAFPVFSIIEPAAAFVAASDLDHVGLLATEFTVRTGHYQRLIHDRNPSIVVHALGSKTLAALIEAPEYDGAAVDAEVALLLAALGKEHPVENIILGCTHYPIAMESFRKYAPSSRFIDPALFQAKEIQRFLEDGGYTPSGDRSVAPDNSRGIAPDNSRGALEIYTSGSAAAFERILKLLKIGMPGSLHAQR
jgi:glutamate racemase